MTHIITVTNSKGGVTKTTTTINLAACFAMLEHDTLIIDFDSQGHAATSLGLDPAPCIYSMFVQEQAPHLFTDETGRDHLSIIRSNQRTKQVINILNQSIASGDVDRWQLAHTLMAVCAPYQFVVIDTPATGILQEVALQAADTVVIPVSLDYLGMDGLANTMATIAKMSRDDLRTIILPTMQEFTNDSRYYGKMLAESYTACMAQPVPKCAAVRESLSQGKTIWEYDGRRTETLKDACTAYERLADMILSKVVR